MESKKRKQIIAENITKYRKEKGITQKELAEAVGVSSSAMTEYMKLRTAPSYGVIQNIADYFGVKKSDIDSTFRQKNEPVSETKRILDNIFENLDKSNQTLLINNAKELFEKQNIEKVIQIHEKAPAYEIEEPEKLHEVIGHSQVAAGLGYGYDDEDNYIVYTDRDDLPCYDLATMVTGKSMEPEYHKGQMLLLRDLGTTSYNGELCVIADDDKSYFKKLYTEDDQLRLVSLNPEYDDIIIPFPPDEGSHIKIFSVVDSFEPVDG
ncbi:helix-turn-helix transcriptional regulator [Pseudolactococcus yaeyamensis]